MNRKIIPIYLFFLFVALSCWRKESVHHIPLDQSNQFILFLSSNLYRDQSYSVQANPFLVFAMRPDGKRLQNLSSRWEDDFIFHAWISQEEGFLVLRQKETNNLYLTQPPFEEKLLLGIFSPLPKDFSSSSDGKYLFFVHPVNKNLIQKKIASQAQMSVLDSGPCSRPQCSPNRKWVCFFKDELDQKDLYVYSILQEKKYRLAKNVEAASWGPSSKLVFDSQKQIYQVSLNKRVSLSKRVPQKLGLGTFAKVSPNGKYLAFLQENEDAIDLVIQTNEDRKEIYRFSARKYKWQPRMTPDVISWSPGSHEVIFIAEELGEEELDGQWSFQLSKSHALIKVNLENEVHFFLRTEYHEAIFALSWLRNNPW